MRRDTRFLTMRTDGDRHAKLGKLMCLTRAVIVDIVFLRRDFAACIVRRKLGRRIMLGHQRMTEHIGMCAPIRIAGWAAIGHDKGRGVPHLRFGEELKHIAVENIERHIVLNGGVAIGNQVHVHAEQRTAFRHRTHIFLKRGGNNLLTLFTARLVIVFDAVRTLRLQPPDMRKGIIKAIDFGIHIGGLCAVHNLARGEGTRPDNKARALHFHRRENRRGAAGWIMPRGDTHGEVEHIHPVLLRCHFIDTMRTMGVGVDKTRNDGLSGNIHGLSSRRDREVSRLADGFDPVIFHQDDGIVDDPAILVRHGHDPRAGEGDEASWTVRLHCHRKRNAVFW